MARLVLWDIDRTLLYVGEVDRLVYREVFVELVGREPTIFPPKGSGRTVPVAVRAFLLANGVSEPEAEALVPRALALLPSFFAARRQRVAEEGVLLPGAVSALRTVASLPETVSTVVTGNLRANAELKLSIFGLDRYLDTTVGGFSSDDPHRPRLVSLARHRAALKHGADFSRRNTVIIGDSLQDVVSGREGGATVIGVASGTTSADQLRRAGAQVVLDSLLDVDALVTAVLTLTTE